MKINIRKIILISVCVCMFLIASKAQNKWIADMKPFDVKTENLSDLNYIGKVIGDSRIVILGEQDHGDATSMQAKSKMVQYLIEKKGFKVLLWESDFFPFNEISVIDSCKTFVHPHWSAPAAMQPLWNYFSEKANKAESVIMNGFGTTFNSPYAQRNIRLRLEALLKEKQLSLEKSADKVWFLSVVDSLVMNNSNRFDTVAQTKFYSWCDRLQKELRGKPRSVVSFEEQLIYNIRAKAEQTWLRQYRVKHMAANAHWLLENRYKNKKVIIWTANYHAIKDYGKAVENHPISGPIYQNAVDKDTVKSFTQLLLEKGHESVYSLACISLSGTYTPRAWINLDNPVEKIDPPKGNIETLLNRETDKSLFADLKTLPGDHLLRSPLYMIPVSHTRSLMSQWEYVFDGILFIKEQKGLKEPIQ